MAAALAPNESVNGEEEQVTYGLIHCHNQMNTLAQQIFDAAAHARAVATLLQARGIMTETELAAQRKIESEQLMATFQERKVGVRLSSTVPDKYALQPDALPQIDCASRYHLCHAACCALRFPLTRQDLEEGVMRWEFGEPYLNRQGPDGLCVHLDRQDYRCSIYNHRPGVCRIYDCRNDVRIWQDFDNYVINPDLIVYGENGERRVQFDVLEPSSGEPSMDRVESLPAT